jgi:subtilisin family serine protease
VSGLGFRYGVLQIFLIMILMPLAWVWVSLRKIDNEQTPGAICITNLAFPTLLIGLTIALPSMLVDPNELALIISIAPGDALQWSSQAARISSLTALIWAIVIVITAGRTLFPSLPTSPADRSYTPGRKIGYKPIAIAVVLIWLIGAGVYFFAGQPGFFGDRMFVILNNRASLEGAVEIKDYAQRRLFVYQSLVNQANVSQSNIRQVLDRFHISYQPYYLVNAFEVTNNPLLRVWLKTRDEVEQIVDSPRMRPLAKDPPQTLGSEAKPTQVEWNLSQIGAERVWKEFNVRGQGVVVGQSDSGVQWDHPDLYASYRGKDGNHNYNWLDPWNASPTPVDQNGHGTHTLGTILGKYTGVAPQATWIGCVNLSRNLGNPALYLDCMQFMLAPYPQGSDPFQDGKPELGAMVLNNSWGCPEMEGCNANTLLDAAYALRQAGVFVVASAGNEGPTCSSVTDPLAIYSQALTVGAIDRSGNLANFSSLGPVTVDGSGRTKPDLVAPGVDILSTFPGGTYAIESGTSMAGPHVVGVVALMWSANPALIGDIERTEQILRQTSRPYTGPLPACPGSASHPSTASGYGVIDAYAAVKLALSLR